MASSYIPGYINSMDVLGFGSTTQSAMFWQSQHAALDIHNGVQCDGCGANPLRGIRWHCKSCPDHDICNNCKKQGLFAGHPFEIMSMTSTNNANAIATGGQVTPEAGVHWTSCKGCGMSPIKGTLYTCTVCPNFNMCQSCNTQRIQNPDAHPHRFDFNYMPQACNPPPDQVGGRLQGQPQFQAQGQFQNQGPPLSAQQFLQQGQYPQQQQGYGAPPPPHYHQKQQVGTGRKIYNWLQHGKMELDG